MAKTEVKTKIKPNLDLARPHMYKVIYMNDDITTVEFVVNTLTIFFDFSESAAFDMATKINEDGSAIVAVLPYEIAEQKGIEITSLARNQGYPLQIKLEGEN